MTTTGPIAIGVDLGGTNVRVAAIDAAGHRLNEYFDRIPPGAAGDVIVTEVAARIAAVRGSSQPVGLGLGIAGVVDENGHLVSGMNNLPALAGRAVGRDLERATGLACRIDNDARAAMRGEAVFGAARGLHNALLITLGTGIGGGLLLDGHIHAGPRRMAGEVGLTLARGDGSDPGRWFPLEDVASPGGLHRTHGLDLVDIMVRAATGETAEGRRLAAIVDHLAIAIVNAHVLLDLERVLLSGGMMRAGEPLLAALRAATHQRCPEPFRSSLVVDAAQLGEWAGAMGAAAMWLTPDDDPR